MSIIQNYVGLDAKIEAIVRSLMGDVDVDLTDYYTKEEVDRFVNALDDVLTNAANVTGPLWKFGTRLLSAAMANKKNK